MRVIAIDPGYERLGIAVLEKTATAKEELLYSDCFQTPKSSPFILRLQAIGKQISKIIEKYEPDALAIESLYFSSNQKTAMHVAEVRGVIMYEAINHKLTFSEYTPSQIKMSVTGDGRADKKQIYSMVGKLVKINKKVGFDDEYDAVAIGISFLASTNAYKK